MIERHADMGQTCWVCGGRGVPNDEPGWFSLAFHPVGSDRAPWPAPILHGHALCPDHAQQMARFLGGLKTQAQRT